MLVYELEGKVVSTCTLVIVTNLTHAQRPWAMIENVVTDPKYRGRSFASACLAAAKAIAEEQGCYRISVMTGFKRESTLWFYKQAEYSDQIKTAFVQYLNHEKK